MSARLAAKKGYKNVKVFHAGIPAWTAAGQPLMVTQKFVKDRMGYIVLIDTRGSKAAKAGQIQGAVAMPLDKIVSEKNQFPLDRKAYIVFYGEDTNLKGIAPVIKTVATWGYQRLLVLDGGFKGWKKADGPTEKDLVRNKIFYMPRPLPGEVTGDEFMNVVRTKPAGKKILDVRTKAETASGMLPGALNIPVDELQANLDKLDKSQEHLVHCRTGLRAQMGYNILRNAKFKARFLNDKVAVLQDQIFCCFK